jgi:hypothetical protein
MSAPPPAFHNNFQSVVVTCGVRMHGEVVPEDNSWKIQPSSRPGDNGVEYLRGCDFVDRY